MNDHAFVIHHGPKISSRDYDRGVVSLHRRAKGSAEAIEQGELDLMIDHRLGTQFPSARRQQLLEQVRAVRKHTPWYLVCGFLTRPTDPSSGLIKPMVKKYSQVLSDSELMVFLDLSPSDLKKMRRS